MKTLQKYITEKLLINKDSKFEKGRKNLHGAENLIFHFFDWYDTKGFKMYRNIGIRNIDTFIKDNYSFYDMLDCHIDTFDDFYEYEDYLEDIFGDVEELKSFIEENDEDLTELFKEEYEEEYKNR